MLGCAGEAHRASGGDAGDGAGRPESRARTVDDVRRPGGRRVAVMDGTKAEELGVLDAAGCHVDHRDVAAAGA